VHLSRVIPIEGQRTQLHYESRTNYGDLLKHENTEQALIIYLLEGDNFHVQFQLTGLPVAGHFVDRDAEIEEMEENLLPTEAQNRRKIHILHGLGGVGKTQLAIAYARKHQHTYSAIVWVNGNNTDTVLQSLAAFARRVGLSGVPGSKASTAQQAPEMKAEADAVLRWLALQRIRRWLMIFDNVDRDVGSDDEDAQAYDVTSFLPAADHGSVLITTRLSSLGEIGKSTEVTRLRPDQALELLSNRSGLHPSSNGTISLPSESESTNQLINLQI
jgi:NB-ARC domain